MTELNASGEIVIVKRNPVLIGEISTPGLREGLITAIIRSPDVPCFSCAHPASIHTDDVGCSACRCSAETWEALGWTMPGSCAGGCR